MKVTLDHNCLIGIKKNNTNCSALMALIGSGQHGFFIVNVGSSELRQGGIRADNYSSF